MRTSHETQNIVDFLNGGLPYKIFAVYTQKKTLYCHQFDLRVIFHNMDIIKHNV
jgi:hypothetical protein